MAARHPPRAGRRRRGACSPSCPASPRSSGPPSGSTRCPPTSISTACTAASIPAAQRAAIAAAAAGPAQGRARHLDRRDQPDPGRRPDRRRFRPRPPPALRPRRRAHPPGHRARQPGGGDPARRPRRAAGAGARLPALGGGGDRRPAALRSARNPGGGPVGACCSTARIWGVADPRDLRWLDPPPAAAVDEARQAPDQPRRARRGRPPDRPWPRDRRAAAAAAPRPYADRGRGARLGRDRGRGRGAALRARARRAGRRSGAAAAALARREGQARRGGAGAGEDAGARCSRSRRRPGASAIGLRRRRSRRLRRACAFPRPRSSKRRDATGADWLSVGGRGFRLDPASPLAREAWLAVAEVGGAAAGARILSAAPIDQATVESLFADRIATRHPA